MKIEIEPYAPQHLDQWNNLCALARNGLFIFDRNYMDYHSDRFTDNSALIYCDGHLVAVFPAVCEGKSTIISHAGLTFGGLLSIPDVRTNQTLAIISQLVDYYKNEGANQLVVKPVPAVFSKYPSGDLDYALWRSGFSLFRRDLSSILPIGCALPFNASKKRSIKTAVKAGAVIREDNIFEFHGLLSSVLNDTHGVTPVHSLHELELLFSRFPNNIALKTAYIDDKLVAGTIIFKYNHVWHTQYLANSGEGKKVGALDFVVASLIDEARSAGCSFISFGTSTTDEGRTLNEGLVWQKESFGARGMTHDYYVLELKKESYTTRGFNPLDPTSL